MAKTDTPHPQWISRQTMSRLFQVMHKQGPIVFPKMAHAKIAVIRNDG